MSWILPPCMERLTWNIAASMPLGEEGVSATKTAVAGSAANVRLADLRR